MFCKTLGTSKTVRLPIFKWPAPEKAQVAVNKVDMDALKRFPFLRFSADSTVSVLPGEWKIDTDMKIPEGYTLKVSGGTKLKLAEGASVISQGPLQWLGSTETPVLVEAEGSGSAILVMGANRKSVLKHVHFSNLGSRTKNAQFTDGAVTFFKSDVDMENCRFLQIKAKDALSLHESEYALTRCLFKDVAGDGIDANYANGLAKDLIFENVGKDALEISGGWLRATKIEVNKALGAGFNANAHAQATIDQLIVRDSEKGTVSSDLSDILIKKLNLKKVGQGMIAFRKLPEYGGGKITVYKLEKKEEVRQLHIVELGASLMLEGKEIKSD